MTYNELAELFKREGGDAQVCFSVISQNQILFGNNDTKKDIISFKNEEPIKWVKEAQEEPVNIWHDASKEKPLDGKRVLVIKNNCLPELCFYDKNKDVYGISHTTQHLTIPPRKWAYVDELINLSNVERTANNLKEQPVNEDLIEASAEYAATGKILANGKEMIDFQKQRAFMAGAKWGRNQAMAEIQARSMALAHGCPKGSVTEDLGEYINELSKQFPEVSFAKLSRIAVRVAKWQKQQDQSIIELAEDHAYFAGRTKTIDEIKEALLSEVLPCFMHGGEADEVVAKLDEVLNQKK